MVLSLVVFSIGTGVTVSALGYYTPFVYASSILMSIGAGLLATWHVNTGEGMWLGYQVVYGAGVGCGMQQSLIMAQTVLHKKDIPIGTAIMMFSQTLGGAIFISVAQNVFTNELLKNIEALAIPHFNPQIVLATGATSLKTVIPAKFLPAVQVAYNTTVINTFYVGLATAVLSAVGAVFWEWKSVKGKPIAAAGGA